MDCVANTCHYCAQLMEADQLGANWTECPFRAGCRGRQGRGWLVASGNQVRAFWRL